MADPVVHLTNGVPDSGSGNITTLGQTLLDGANVTIGAKADAKSTATDTTPVSAISVWKQISASVQAIATSIAGTLVVATHAVTGSGNFASTVADGANTTLGAKADAKSAATDTTSISIMSVLKQISASIQAAATSLAATLTVAVAPSTVAVAVTPTVTASAYSAGNVIGGIMTFASVLAATSFNGVLHSITAKFKGTAVTGSIEVAIFKASPSNGTYTDKSAPTWSAADMANLVGIYTLPTPNSKLGTMTIFNLDAIGKAIVGASQSLFAVVIVDGTPTPASTSDFTLELAVLPG